MTESICFEEWMGELQRVATQTDTSAVTVTELVRKHGRSRAFWIRLMRQQIRDGVTERIKTHRQQPDGRIHLVPAYRPVTKTQ